MYLVKCKLLEFVRDEKEHPCHFNYKIGDEIYYDGERFTGRICHGLLASMIPVVHETFLLGHKYSETVAFKYRGEDIRDPEMEEYDGAGFRTVIPPGEENEAKIKPGKYDKNAPSGRSRGHHFFCSDQRTLAHFSCVPVDLSDCGYAQPFYRRAIAILEKIESEPGIDTSEIIKRFTDFQKNTISPRLTTLLMGVLLEALEDMEYITITDGKATATGKEPPSRPVLPPDKE